MPQPEAHAPSARQPGIHATAQMRPAQGVDVHACCRPRYCKVPLREHMAPPLPMHGQRTQRPAHRVAGVLRGQAFNLAGKGRLGQVCQRRQQRPLVVTCRVGGSRCSAAAACACGCGYGIWGPVRLGLQEGTGRTRCTRHPVWLYGSSSCTGIDKSYVWTWRHPRRSANRKLRCAPALRYATCGARPAAALARRRSRSPERRGTHTALDLSPGRPALWC
mgnify:CR=1 FL=1